MIIAALLLALVGENLFAAEFIAPPAPPKRSLFSPPKPPPVSEPSDPVPPPIESRLTPPPGVLGQPLVPPTPTPPAGAAPTEAVPAPVAPPPVVPPPTAALPIVVPPPTVAPVPSAGFPAPQSAALSAEPFKPQKIAPVPSLESAQPVAPPIANPKSQIANPATTPASAKPISPVSQIPNLRAPDDHAPAPVAPKVAADDHASAPAAIPNLKSEISNPTKPPAVANPKSQIPNPRAADDHTQAPATPAAPLAPKVVADDHSPKPTSPKPIAANDDHAPTKPVAKPAENNSETISPKTAVAPPVAAAPKVSTPPAGAADHAATGHAPTAEHPTTNEHPATPANENEKAHADDATPVEIPSESGPPISGDKAAFHLEKLVKGTTNLNSAADGVRLRHSTQKLTEFQTHIELARQQRRDGYRDLANKKLIRVIESDAPSGFKRVALYELGVYHEADKDLQRAQQIFAQFLKEFPEDSMMPEILLRQGRIYRQMGAYNQAIGKFYTVLSASLNLKVDKLDYYKTLVLYAQTEIADTFAAQGKNQDAADFYQRLLRLPSPELNKPQIQFKLIHCLAALDHQPDVVQQCEELLRNFPDAPEVPETRYEQAMALKRLNRTAEAMKAVLELLKSQQAVANADSANWIYWQQRTGNELANHLYKENDNLNALVLYQNLADISSAPNWRLPVWYQTGLVYERLRQPQKAIENYDRILQAAKESDAKSNPSLSAVADMAKWRKDYLAWYGRADRVSADLRATPPEALPTAPAENSAATPATLPNPTTNKNESSPK